MIREAQIYQEHPEAIEIKIVKRAGYYEKDEQ
jgi:hypothetical protein